MGFPGIDEYINVKHMDISFLERNHSLVCRWIRAGGEKLPAPAIPEDALEIEFDEMWHFIGSKKRNLNH
jgi:hypothetical protein